MDGLLCSSRGHPPRLNPMLVAIETWNWRNQNQIGLPDGQPMVQQQQRPRKQNGPRRTPWKGFHPEPVFFRVLSNELQPSACAHQDPDKINKTQLAWWTAWCAAAAAASEADLAAWQSRRRASRPVTIWAVVSTSASTRARSRSSSAAICSHTAASQQGLLLFLQDCKMGVDFRFV